MAESYEDYTISGEYVPYGAEVNDIVAPGDTSRDNDDGQFTTGQDGDLRDDGGYGLSDIFEGDDDDESESEGGVDQESGDSDRTSLSVSGGGGKKAAQKKGKKKGSRRDGEKGDEKSRKFTSKEIIPKILHIQRGLINGVLLSANEGVADDTDDSALPDGVPEAVEAILSINPATLVGTDFAVPLKVWIGYKQAIENSELPKDTLVNTLKIMSKWASSARGEEYKILVRFSNYLNVIPSVNLWPFMQQCISYVILTSEVDAIYYDEVPTVEAVSDTRVIDVVMAIKKEVLEDNPVPDGVTVFGMDLEQAWRNLRPRPSKEQIIEEFYGYLARIKPLVVVIGGQDGN